jgi:hypothetical protein
MLVTENKRNLKERYCRQILQNIIMKPSGAGWDVVDWVDLAHDRDKYKSVTLFVCLLVADLVGLLARH